MEYGEIYGNYSDNTPPPKKTAAEKLRRFFAIFSKQ